MKFSFVSIIVSTALLCSALAPLNSAADDKALTKPEVEAIVKKVIQDNPELILKTLMEYQQKEQMARISKAAQNLSKMQDKIKNDPRSPTIGNPDGDVTITEFFDYHCGYCKRFFPEIGKLLHEDSNVRVVFKEFPILSADSAVAARAALAVYNVDKSKYFDYHILLMQSSGEFTKEMLTDKAKQVGIDPDVFTKAFNDPELLKDLERNKLLAKNLEVTGTPGIIIGTELLPGAIDYQTLKAKVLEVRDAQNQKKNAEKE